MAPWKPRFLLKFLKKLNCKLYGRVLQAFTFDCFRKLHNFSFGKKQNFSQFVFTTLQQKIYSIKSLEPHSWGQDNSEELKPLRRQLAVIYGGDTFMTMELFATYFTTGQIPLLSSL